MRRSLRAAFLCLLAAGTAHAGERPTLRLVWFCAHLKGAIARLATEYPKAQVSVDCLPFHEWHDRIVKGFEEKSGADLVMLDSQFLGEAVTGKHVVELTDWMRGRVDLADFVPAALTGYGEYPQGARRYWAVPGLADTQVLVYRRDLYESASARRAYREQTGRELRPPTTWSELLAQARFWKGSQWTKAGYAATWKGPGGYDEISTQWNQILWSFGGELWDPKTRRVQGVLNTEPGVKALRFATDLFQTGPDGSAEFGFDETIGALCDGTAAIGNTWFALAPRFTDARACALAPKLGFGVVPGEVRHVISLGGQGISVSAYTRERGAALEFLEWFASKPVQLRWVELGGASARRSVMNSKAYLAAEPYNRFFAQSYAKVKDFWNVPEYAALVSAEQDSLHAAVTGKATAQAALDELAAKAQAILDDADRKAKK